MARRFRDDEAEKALELDTRRLIYEHIELVPGTHFREIHRRLKIPTGVVEYHLKYLEDRELIVAKKEGRYKRYYIIGTMGSHDKMLLSLLRQKIPRHIIMHLLLNPRTTHKELRSLFGISASTLSFHLSKLLKNEIIEQKKSGRENEYIVIDDEAIAKALVRFKKGFVDVVVDEFVETWMEIHP
jgi:predicted transcriptional regulator